MSSYGRCRDEWTSQVGPVEVEVHSKPVEHLIHIMYRIGLWSIPRPQNEQIMTFGSQAKDSGHNSLSENTMRRFSKISRRSDRRTDHLGRAVFDSHAIQLQLRRVCVEWFS